MANSFVALKEQQQDGQPARRRRRQLDVKRNVTDETLMASSSGDVVWLEQTLRNNFKKALTQTKEQVTVSTNISLNFLTFAPTSLG